MNIVVFAGAGFSAPFGFPVMNNFFSTSRTISGLTEKQIEILDEIIGESNQANRIVNTSPTNLESVLSMAVMGDRLGIGKERNDDILKIIGKVYRSVNVFSNYWHQFEKLETMLGFSIEENFSSIKFITTNYDLCIESALFHSKVSIESFFDFKEDPSGHINVFGDFHKSYTKKVPLFKLHGSVNWFESENGIIVDNRIVLTGNGAGFPFPYPLTRNYGTISNYQTERKPVIIPPSFLKPEISSQIKEIWSSAARSLQNADILIFIGYSFPQSDTEMKFFLGKALESNVRLNSIHILDKNANQIVDRLRKPESGYGSHFLDYLKPHNSDWTEVELGIEPN